MNYNDYMKLQQDITNIMINNAKAFNLNYSHKKQNRWNLWISGVGITLSLTLNNSLLIYSVSGVKKKTIHKTYTTTPDTINSWVIYSINTYYKLAKEILEDYYNAIKEAKEEEPLYIKGESDVQRYNRLNEEYLTEEEYKMMYPDPIVEEPPKVKVKRRKKDYTIPGQLSLFDMED